MPFDDTVQQLRRMKAQRSREREIRDFEERMLLDSLEETDRKLKGSPRLANQRKKLHLSKDKAIRDMQIQYERVREQKYYGEPKRDYRKRPDPARYNPQSDPKVKQLAENHGRQMEHLQNRNRDLERQREEIRRRLEDLGRRPAKGDDDSMNALLQELKDQEARNQKMLEELRRLLSTQNIQVPVETKKHQYIYPIYYGNSLVAEIAAVRQAYLQNGGNDPDILQQLAQMQAEAQAIEDSLRNKPATIIKSKDPNSSKLLTLELENERLQRQLLLLQEQNVQAKHRRKDDREGRARAVTYHSPPQKTFTNMQALDFKPELMGGRKTVATTDRGFMREKWMTRVDPVKEKIDSDVQNKFGYDYGANSFMLVQPELPIEDKSRHGIGIETLVPESNNDTAPPKTQEPQPKPFVYNDNEIPYFKHHLTSRKLNRADQDFRESYSRKSQPNVRRGDIELIDRFRDRRNVLTITDVTDITAADTKVESENPDPNNNSNKPHNEPTQFEEEYFVHTARSDMEIGDEYNSQRARPPPQPRPKILGESRMSKK